MSTNVLCISSFRLNIHFKRLVDHIHIVYKMRAYNSIFHMHMRDIEIDI